MLAGAEIANDSFVRNVYLGRKLRENLHLFHHPRHILIAWTFHQAYIILKRVFFVVCLRPGSKTGLIYAYCLKNPSEPHSMTNIFVIILVIFPKYYSNMRHIWILIFQYFDTYVCNTAYIFDDMHILIQFWNSDQNRKMVIFGEIWTKLKEENSFFWRPAPWLNEPFCPYKKDHAINQNTCCTRTRVI